MQDRIWIHWPEAVTEIEEITALWDLELGDLLNPACGLDIAVVNKSVTVICIAIEKHNIKKRVFRLIAIRISD